MKSLVLDFARRWWWMLALAALFSAVVGFAGFPFIFAPLALMGLILDAQRGAFRVVRVLPIPARSQANAWWLIAVLLVPLFSIPALAIGLLIHQAHLPAVVSGISPWFATLVQGWVALGYAGFCFMLVLWLPTQPPEDTAENVVQGLFGALWGLSIPALMFVLPNLPKAPAAVAPWHWAVFAASPFCILLSFLAAPGVMQRRTAVMATKAKSRTIAGPAAYSPGLTGITLFIVNFLVRFAVMLAAVAVGQVVFIRWMMHRLSAPDSNPALGTQFMAIAILFGMLTHEAAGLRSLRVLPLSTTRLALLLSSGSWVAGGVAAVFTALWYGMGNPAWPPLGNFIAQALAFGGYGGLALAATVRIVSGARVFVFMVFTGVPAGLFGACSEYSAGLALTGVVAGTLGFVLLHRALRKSSHIYQPRHIFGLAAGQPGGVR